MEKAIKYELTKESIEISDVTLFRIKALKKFKNVNVGDLGGFVENKDNLTLYDTEDSPSKRWIYNDAMVYGQASISENADPRDAVSVRISFRRACQVPCPFQ